MSSIEVEPHFPNHSELDDLIRELGLIKSNAEILTSRLKEWNLLGESCGITIQRERHKIFSQNFTLADKVCCCHDIDGLFKGIGFLYDPYQWRLFIGGSIRSLKAVLLHNVCIVECNACMMGDYVWGLVRDTRQQYRRTNNLFPFKMLRVFYIIFGHISLS